MIDYILTLIFSFIGIIGGAVLALIAPEELKKGAKYWKILEWIIIAAIVIVLFLFAGILWAIIISAAIILLKILRKEYSALAFALFASFFGNFLFLAGALIFLYGLAKGTLDAMEIVNEKNAKKNVFKAIFYVLRRNIFYLVIGFILLPFLIAYS